MKYLKIVGLWVLEHASRCMITGAYLWLWYQLLATTGDLREAYIVDFWGVLKGLLSLAVLFFISFDAGRESKKYWISPKRYGKQLDDHTEFVDVTIEMEDIQTGRLDYARDLLREQADRMPESSAKQKFLKQIEVL